MYSINDCVYRATFRIHFRTRRYILYTIQNTDIYIYIYIYFIFFCIKILIWKTVLVKEREACFKEESLPQPAQTKLRNRQKSFPQCSQHTLSNSVNMFSRTSQHLMWSSAVPDGTASTTPQAPQEIPKDSLSILKGFPNYPSDNEQ